MWFLCTEMILFYFCFNSGNFLVYTNLEITKNDYSFKVANSTTVLSVPAHLLSWLFLMFAVKLLKSLHICSIIIQCAILIYMLKEVFTYNLHEYMQVLHNVFKGIAVETI